MKDYGDKANTYQPTTQAGGHNRPMQEQYDRSSYETASCLVGKDAPCKEASVIDKLNDLYQQVNNLHRQLETLSTNLSKVMSILGVEWR